LAAIKKSSAMRIVSIIFSLLLCYFAQAQQGQQASNFIKFGKITKENLQKKHYAIDSGASAVVLSDIGTIDIEGNSKGWFSVAVKRHRVVHVLNKNGYFEANVEIPLYASDGDEEKLESIKAVTYNLENGKVVETKLEKSSIFKEKRTSHLVIKKFTFPNVKEGCILEYEYKLTSDYINNLDPWHFQGQSPVLWSECRFSVPQFFTYGFISHGYHPIYINEKKDRQESFYLSNSQSAGPTERVSFNAGVTEYRWVMKDVPELKEESYTTALKNHLSSIEFQLASQSYPLEPHNYRASWTDVTKQLLNSEYFGKGLDNSNNWMGDEMEVLLKGATTEAEKAERIFAYVRDQFTCTDHDTYFASQSLKNIFKSKKGTVSDINLLLTAMLRYAGFEANPVMLSTKDNGYALEYYPMMTAFNYVVSDVNIGGHNYFLDASHERLGFGKLLPECYNGHARIVDEQATKVFLQPDSVHERSVTALFVSNNLKGEWTGSMNQTPGYYSSYNIREKIKEKGQEEFFKQVEKDFGIPVKIEKPTIDSLKNYDVPVGIKYELVIDPEKADIMYINPLFGEAWKKNPFTAAQRYYPVEMPYTIDETYILTMEVPAGYEVDEMPKQMIAKMDEQGSGMFEYRITKSANTISMRCRLQVNRTLFVPAEYEMLRAFFNIVVSKENEQIVFKKIK
jgi:hypothetical protein